MRTAQVLNDNENEDENRLRILNYETCSPPKGAKVNYERTDLLYENEDENENLSATRAWASGWLFIAHEWHE